MQTHFFLIQNHRSYMLLHVLFYSFISWDYNSQSKTHFLSIHLLSYNVYSLTSPRNKFSSYHLCCFLTTPYLIYFHLPRELACSPSPIHFLTKHVDMIAEALSFISGKTCLSQQASRYIHSGTEDNLQRIPRTFAKPHWSHVIHRMMKSMQLKLDLKPDIKQRHHM